MFVRKLMGIGSYIIFRGGMNLYCMSDGKTHCTEQDYQTVENNLLTKLGAPDNTDPTGNRYWFHAHFGCMILPTWRGHPFAYVEVDPLWGRKNVNGDVLQKETDQEATEYTDFDWVTNH